MGASSDELELHVHKWNRRIVQMKDRDPFDLIFPHRRGLEDQGRKHQGLDGLTPDFLGGESKA
jgi:hypothetical protein